MANTNMKDYIVWVDGIDDIYLVSAQNAKDAISQVWESEIAWRNEYLRAENKQLGYYANHIYAKSELSAQSIKSLYKEQGKIVMLH